MSSGVVREGSSVVFSGEADWVAEVDSRQYLIANDDGDDQKWYLLIQIGPQPVYTGEFNSLDAAKRYAEDWEDARNARYAEGYQYAERRWPMPATGPTSNSPLPWPTS